MPPLPHIPEPAPVKCDAGSVVANGDFQSPREECVAATRPVQRFETFLSGPWRKIGPIQRFVHHIDKGLCIVPKKATDRVTLVFT